MLPRPSCHNVAFILFKCSRNNRDSAHVLANIRQHVLPSCPIARSLQEGHQISEPLAHRKNCSWMNILLPGYVEFKLLQHSLTLQTQTQKSLLLNAHAAMALLKACTRLQDMENGIEIHAEVVRSGLLEKDSFIGSALIHMYGECGLMRKAEEVFFELKVHDTTSWNTLISAYAKCGCPKEALESFERMQLKGVNPDGVTYVSVLKACYRIKAMDKVCVIHEEISRKGLLDSNIFVSSILINIYTKWGLLVKATEVFEKVPQRNVVVWNALLTGYVEHGRFDDSLKYYEQMQSEGVCPDAVTYVCILKSCCSIGTLEKAQELHAEIVRKALLQKNPFLASALIDAYVNVGALRKAEEVLERLRIRNTVACTALIAGYIEHGCSEEALRLFDQMQHEGIPPDATTFLCCLKACADTGSIEKGQKVHVDLERAGLLENDLVLANMLVYMYARFGLLVQAQSVFDKLLIRNVVTWTGLIAGFVENGRCNEALECFEIMQYEGICPNVVTYICTLQACSSIGDFKKGIQIHKQVEKEGLLSVDVLLGNTLLNMYAKCGLVYNALDLLDNLPRRDTVTWNAMISGYTEHDYGEEALTSFERMQLEGIFPDAVTYTCCLKACGCVGAIEKGWEIHNELTRNGFVNNYLIVGSALVDMYAKCGAIVVAQEILNKLPIQDIVSWNSLLAGYAQLGQCEEVFHTFENMLTKALKPDIVTFIIILNVCSRTGLYEKSQTYFQAMSKEYGIAPTLEHHSCVINLFGRTGQVDEAITMIKKMPFFPNLAIWNIVLGACRDVGKVELGKEAFDNAVQLIENDSVAYG